MRRLQLFITVVFLLFVFAAPSFAVAGPTYTEENMVSVNDVVVHFRMQAYLKGLQSMLNLERSPGIYQV